MKPIINRRHFIAAASAAALVTKASLASTTSNSPRLAFTATKQKLHIYAIINNIWHPLQTLDSEAPTALAIDHRTRTLHVLHAVDQYRNLPRGYIESFRINKASSHLEPTSHQPLSLSATQPKHLAIAPNGKLLAVSIPGGAAYNLLPIREDGTIAPPIAIRKEASTLSIPGPLAFNYTSNKLFTLDQGHQTLTIFSAEPALPLLARIDFPGNFNPIQLTAHPDEDLLTVTSRTDSQLTFRYDTNSKLSLTPETHRNTPQANSTVAQSPYATQAAAIAFL